MGVSMSQIISKFPAMMLGFIGENDLKILEYDEDIVVFESANDIEQPFDLTLCIFDLPSYDYKEYCFRNCILQKSINPLILIFFMCNCRALSGVNDKISECVETT